MKSVNLSCAECCAWADEVETLRERLTFLSCDLGSMWVELAEARATIDRINAECNVWSNRAKIAEANLDVTRRNMQREINDLERENASLRRRLRDGGR